MTYPLKHEPFAPMPADQEPDNDKTRLSPAPDAAVQPIATQATQTRKPLWPPENPLQAMTGGIIVLLLGAILGFGISQTTRLDTRIDRLEDKIDRLEDKFEAKFDKVDARFAEIDARIDELDAKIDEINLKLTTLIAVLNATAQVEDAIEGNITIPSADESADRLSPQTIEKRP